jgi:hypothetical protein
MEENERRAQQQYEITRDNILKELAILAFSNISKVADWNKDGLKLKDSDSVPDEYKAFIQQISFSTSEFPTMTGGVNRSSSVSIKTWNKPKALELLGKIIGLFEEKDEENDIKKAMNRALEKLDEEGA